MNNFFTSWSSHAPELVSFFSGFSVYDFKSPLERRLLQLSSVKYIATTAPFTTGEPSGAAVPFQEIYNKEAKVYRYDDVVPRAAVYYHAELRNSEGEVLRTLADPAFDVFQSVVVEAPRLNSRQRAALAAVNQSALRRETPARISSYRSQAVTIDVSADRSAIVVLNDSDYPGWTVDVDGRRDEWFPVNYMFRGVVVPAGRHTVRFVYRPKSFYAGLSITGTALLVLVIVGLIPRRKPDIAPLRAPSELPALASEQ